MSSMRQHPFSLAGLAACLCLAIYGLYASVLIGNDGDRSNIKGETFGVTGNTYLDVQRALVTLGEMSPPLTSRRSSRIEQAIRDAEVRRGLRVDGDPDGTLLDHLLGDIDRSLKSGESSNESPPRSWFADLANLSTIVGALGTWFFGWATWRRSK